MINMTNRPNVQMRLRPLELLLGHNDAPCRIGAGMRAG
jgi:hypothetical protein